MHMHNCFQTKQSAVPQSFHRSNWNLEGHWEVTISELSDISRYWTVTERKFISLLKNVSNPIQFYFLEPGLRASITDSVEAKKFFIQIRKNHKENCLTIKVSQEHKKLRFILLVKHLVLHFLLRLWDTFSKKMLARTLEFCWEKECPTNREKNTTLLAYALSWFTQTWLSTKLLATQKLQSFVAFLLVLKLKVENITLNVKYMKYSTFGNLLFRKLLKKVFHSFHLSNSPQWYLFAFVNTQPSNMQREHWILIANSSPKCFLKTLSNVKIIINWNSNTSRWCETLYSPIIAFVVSTRLMQLAKSSKSNT